jgi:hypothetical protein
MHTQLPLAAADDNRRLRRRGCALQAMHIWLLLASCSKMPCPPARGYCHLRSGQHDAGVLHALQVQRESNGARMTPTERR